MTQEAFNAFDTIWLILGAVLVFWMQAGFAMVEAGFTRAKNTGNIIMKNLMDFCIGTCTFILINGLCNWFNCILVHWLWHYVW